ncbi:unnamed protein product [Paramecium sonneborni]|uniref:Uncharacterized protein n=1 Tax=Paramecium sonneborni TaxID=65129 RepID=A0A8S1MRZ3_9CILI|nr:unnamed protein product [Paramecium sonneborni]
MKSCNQSIIEMVTNLQRQQCYCFIQKIVRRFNEQRFQAEFEEMISQYHVTNLIDIQFQMKEKLFQRYNNNMRTHHNKKYLKKENSSYIYFREYAKSYDAQQYVIKFVKRAQLKLLD